MTGQWCDEKRWVGGWMGVPTWVGALGACANWHVGPRVGSSQRLTLLALVALQRWEQQWLGLLARRAWARVWGRRPRVAGCVKGALRRCETGMKASHRATQDTNG